MRYFKFIIILLSIVISSCSKDETSLCGEAKLVNKPINKYITSQALRIDSLFYFEKNNDIFSFNVSDQIERIEVDKSKIFKFKTWDNEYFFTFTSEIGDVVKYRKKTGTTKDIFNAGNFGRIMNIIPSSDQMVYLLIKSNDVLRILKVSTSGVVKSIDDFQIPNSDFFSISEIYNFKLADKHYFSFIISQSLPSGEIEHQYMTVDTDTDKVQVYQQNSEKKYLGQLFGIDNKLFVTMLLDGRNVITVINPFNGEPFGEKHETGIPARVELNEFLLVEKWNSIHSVSLKNGQISQAIENVSEIYDLIMIDSNTIIVNSNKVNANAAVYDLKTGCKLYELPGYESYFEDAFFLPSKNQLIIVGLSGNAFIYDL